MGRRFPPEFKRDVVTVARRPDATYKELASDFEIPANLLRRLIKQADVADGLTAGPPAGGPDDVVALRRRLRLL